MGSRRIMLVKPGRYSPATAPCIARAAPAKKRNTSAIAGISSFSAAASGLPQFCDSRPANSVASASMRSASFSSSVLRSFGTVAAHPGNAFAAACTAAVICSSDASATCAMTLPVAGSSTPSSSPLPLTSLPLTSSFVFIVGPREVVSQQDRNERHRNDDDGHHVGDGTIPRAEELVQEPDRQRAFIAGREDGDDDLVERQRERKHATGEECRRYLRQRYVAECLEAVGAKIHRGFHPVRRQPAQPRDDVVVDDHDAERGVARNNGPEGRIEPAELHRGEQRNARDDARQSDG